MAKARNGGLTAALLLALTALTAGAALAQETPSQFDKANAEARRHTEAQQQLRNRAHQNRLDENNARVTCQGAGSAAAQGACNSNVDIGMRNRGLDLHNDAIDERNNHNQILQGLGVHRVP